MTESVANDRALKDDVQEVTAANQRKRWERPSLQRLEAENASAKGGTHPDGQGNSKS